MGEIDGNTANKKAGSSMSENRTETGSAGVRLVVSGSEDGSGGLTGKLFEAGKCLATMTVGGGGGSHFESLSPEEYRFEGELPVAGRRGGDSDGHALSMILDWMDRIGNPTVKRGRRTWEDVAGDETCEGSEPRGMKILVRRHDRYGNHINPSNEDS